MTATAAAELETADALTLAILAVNDFLHPEATTEADVDRLKAHAGAVLERLTALRAEHAPMPLAIVGVVDEELEDDDQAWQPGDVVIVCPAADCGAVNEWYEVDRSERWNTIHISGSNLAVAQEDAEHETVGYKCQRCGALADLPELGSRFDEARGWWVQDDLFDVSWY